MNQGAAFVFEDLDKFCRVAEVIAAPICFDKDTFVTKHFQNINVCDIFTPWFWDFCHYFSTTGSIERASINSIESIPI
jgi:hypothetical protein